MKLKNDIPLHFYAEEIREGYTISTSMKRIWAVQLDILMEITRVCKKYGIKYFAIGGTLLGAARHRGYIPWDDDLDIAMPREDYDKFCQIAPKEFKHPYFMQTEATDPGYLLRHAKVRNSETTAILNVQREHKFRFNQGIFVDIFPLDNIPNDMDERNRYFDDLYEAWGNTYNKSSYVNRGIKKGTWENSDIPTKETAILANSAYEALSSKYKNCKTEEVALLVVTISTKGRRDNCIWNNCDFEEIKYVPFEFLSLPVPCNYEQILTKQYGNWKEFVIADSYHGQVFWDTEHPYIDYLT